MLTIALRSGTEDAIAPLARTRWDVPRGDGRTGASPTGDAGTTGPSRGATPEWGKRGAKHMSASTPPTPVTVPAVAKVATADPKILAVTEAEALADMARAAHAVLAHFITGEPVRVIAVGVGDRLADRRHSSTRFYRAEKAHGGVPRVEVGLSDGQAFDAAVVAAAVAVGLAHQAYPITSTTAPERKRQQRHALHRVTQTPKAPKASAVDAVLQDARPDTSPLARAIVAAEKARAGRSIGGARADAGQVTGGRFVIEWDQETELGPMRRTLEVRPAKAVSPEDVGTVASLKLVIEPRDADGKRRTATLATGKLVFEKKDPVTRKLQVISDPGEAKKATRR